MAETPKCDIAIEAQPINPYSANSATHGVVRCRTHGISLEGTTLASNPLCPIGRIEKMEAAIDSILTRLEWAK